MWMCLHFPKHYRYTLLSGNIPSNTTKYQENENPVYFNMVICSNGFILNCLRETKEWRRKVPGWKVVRMKEKEVTVYSVSPPLSDLELGTCHWLTHLIFTTTLRGQNACSKFTDDKTMNQRGWASLGAPQWGWDAEDCWYSIPKVNFYLIYQGCFCNFIFLNHLLILKDLYFLETK